MLPRAGPLLRPVVGVVGHAVAIDITDSVLHERRLYGLQALRQPDVGAVRNDVVLCSFAFH